MKITKRQLKRIIREEYSRLIRESDWSHLKKISGETIPNDWYIPAVMFKDIEASDGVEEAQDELLMYCEFLENKEAQYYVIEHQEGPGHEIYLSDEQWIKNNLKYLASRGDMDADRAYRKSSFEKVMIDSEEPNFIMWSMN